MAKAPAAKLADFGLDSPAIDVRFRTEDGKERTLDFGKDAPTTGHQFARRDGNDDILILRENLSLNFDKSAWDLRDKAVFPDIEAGSESEARRVEISRPAGKLVLENDNGLWHVREPQRARADRYRVSSLVSRVRNAKMSEIVSETAEGATDDYGLDQPSRRIEIELPEETENRDKADKPEESERNTRLLELSIGAKKGSDFYARTPARPQIFLVAFDLVEELDRKVRDFESMKLFDFETFDVGRFRIETGGETREYVAKKSDSGGEKTWRQTSPEPGRDRDTTAVEDFLYKLNGTTAKTIIDSPDLAKQGLSEPAFVVTVWSKEPEIEEVLRVSKPVGGSVYAIRQGDSVALELASEAWNGIQSLMTMEPKKEKEEKKDSKPETPPS